MNTVSVAMKDKTKTKERAIEGLSVLRDRCTEEALKNYYEIETAVNALLRLSLEDSSLEELLQKALDIILSVPSLSIETKGCIFLVEDEPEVLIQKVQKGLAEPLLKECARVPFGKCLCGRAASIKRIEFADHIDERHEIGYEGMVPHGHYCVPIILSGNTIGVINLYLKDGHSRVGREEEFLDSVANTLAGIIKRKRAEEKLQQTLETLRKAFGTIIQVMVSAVESRDPYTAGHQIRSADLARAIAKEMGLSQEKIDGIHMAGSIHDIGKISIPAELLSKPTKLSELEFSLIKEHANKGFEMLKDVESPWPLAEIVYQHHERMNGSGYPRNLKGDDILMDARILAVADVVETMASRRPYRPGLGINAALEEIEKNKGIFYDITVTDACLRLFREKNYQLQ